VIAMADFIDPFDAQLIREFVMAFGRMHARNVEGLSGELSEETMARFTKIIRFITQSVQSVE
jgi:hypothetical protein